MTDEIVIETSADTSTVTPVPAPPQFATAQPIFVMAKDELFTREQYLAAGWSDEQLIQAGKMHTISAPPATIDIIKPIGMPESKRVVLDDNDDIPPTGLFVGHNGVGFMLQTGLEMTVPTYILDILDQAVVDAPIKDQKTQQVIGYRPRPRFTYREVRENEIV